MKLNAQQKSQLRRISAQHASLHDSALGLSRGMNDRRGERRRDAERELRSAQRELDEAEKYAAESKNDRFIANEMPIVRERLADAQQSVAELDAETSMMQEQYNLLSVDVGQSGRLLDRLVKHADQSEPPAPRVEIPPRLSDIGRGLNEQPRDARTMIEQEIANVEREISEGGR
jgi:hypothetical protein